jgi:hypothetical protein
MIPAPTRRFKRRARRAALIALRAVKRQYLSLLSLAILAAALTLVLTNESFEAIGTPLRQAVAGDEPQRLKPQRRSVVFYIVRDEDQLRAMAGVVGSEQSTRTEAAGTYDFVIFLIGGTAEEESAVISRLDFEATMAQGSNVDMRVIDVRGRRHQ